MARIEKGIKIGTLADFPQFRGCKCIVCGEKPVQAVLEMGGHITQMCMGCLETLSGDIEEYKYQAKGKQLMQALLGHTFK